MNTVVLKAMANILKSGIPGFFVPLSLLLMGSPLFSQSIYRTACNGNLSRLDSLLQTTSINTLDNRGRTLLHWAVACNQEKVLHVLMKQGIKTGVEDKEGMTPLHVAVQFARKNLFDTLVRLQKDSSWIVRYGPAMMEKALLRKKLPMVQKLTENGVDINQANDRGSVPLEIAQRMGLDTIADFLLRMGADESKVRHFQPKGRYMGQEEPGMEPQLFAPNFISTEESEFGSVFSKDNQEFFYAVDVNGKAEIRYSKRIDDQWTPPKILLSHERYGYNDPFLSPDEKRLYFISKRAIDGVSDPKDVDIWFVERKEKTWSEPIHVGTNINSDGNEYYISFTDSGTMYFSSNTRAAAERKESDYDIYSSKFVNGRFQKAIALGPTVNTKNYEADVCVAPDESYIIFCSERPDGFGRGDLYISFKNAEGTWSQSINMGGAINTKHYEYCPFITQDGNYLFFTSQQDIYWVSTQIIDKIRKTK